MSQWVCLTQVEACRRHLENTVRVYHVKNGKNQQKNLIDAWLNRTTSRTRFCPTNASIRQKTRNIFVITLRRRSASKGSGVNLLLSQIMFNILQKLKFLKNIQLTHVWPNSKQTVVQRWTKWKWKGISKSKDHWI